MDKTDDKVIAVYDLGGGTFDISVLEIQKGNNIFCSSIADPGSGVEHFAPETIRNKKKVIFTFSSLFLCRIRDRKKFWIRILDGKLL
jgi:hypothetical protein